MRIAIVTPFANFIGGAEVVNHKIKNILENSGYSVDVFSTENFNNYDKWKLKLFSPQRVLASKYRDVLTSYDVVLCKGEWGYKIDHENAIILFHDSGWGYREAAKPYLGPRSSWRLWKFCEMQKKAAKGKRVISVSDHLRGLLSNQGIFVDQVIENCIDTECFSPGINDLRNDRYLFVGRADYFLKGFDILESIAEKGYQIDCVTSEKVGGLGWIPQRPNHEMPEIYRQYKLLFFPSRAEGLGMAPLEAMACGMPIVMSCVGLGLNLKRIIPEFIVDGFDPIDYINRAKIIESNWDYFSKKAVAYVNEYHNHERFARKWLSVFETLEKNK